MKKLSDAEMVRLHRQEMRRHDKAMLIIHGHADAIRRYKKAKK